jgi:hypothetical protein
MPKKKLIKNDEFYDSFEEFIAEHEAEEIKNDFGLIVGYFLDEMEIEKVEKLITVFQESELEDELKDFIIPFLEDKLEYGKMEFIGTGINLNQKSVSKMLDYSENNCTTIGFKEFSKQVNPKDLNQVIQLLGYALRKKDDAERIQDDDDIEYHKSIYDDRPCLYILKDDVEYVFA